MFIHHIYYLCSMYQVLYVKNVPDDQILNYTRIICCYHIFYYLLDILLESINIFYNKNHGFLYIYHHIFAILNFILFLNTSDFQRESIINFTYFIGYSDLSGMAVSLRDYFKKNNILTIKNDFCLLLLYIYCRVYSYPFIIYKISDNLYTLPVILLAYVMSNYWAFLWSTKLFKRFFNKYIDTNLD